MADWGRKIFPQFEKLTGCKVRVVAAPDSVQVLGRVEIDLKRGKPAADVILGADTLDWERLQKITERDVRRRSFGRGESCSRGESVALEVSGPRAL